MTIERENDMNWFKLLKDSAIKFILPAVIFASFSSCKNQRQSEVLIIASTSWTAAFAEAAGAKNVKVIAPFEMQHPSEYEIKPGDIPSIMNAGLIIYGGYEIMVKRLKQGLNIDDKRLLRIDTSYDMAAIENSVMSIARKLGTEETAVKNIDEIRTLYEDARKQLNVKELNDANVLVHFFQQSMINELGLNTVAVFGPAPPEARQIVELANKEVDMIIDNGHNPVGTSLKEVLPRASYLLLLNFPGENKTRTLSDVIRYNLNQILNSNKAF